MALRGRSAPLVILLRNPSSNLFGACLGSEQQLFDQVAKKGGEDYGGDGGGGGAGDSSR